MSLTFAPRPTAACPDAPQRVRAARPDLPCESSAFRAAVVLLAGPEHGFNIDRIAARCGLARASVAACVRRLIDNGVWAGGRDQCAWRGPDDPRFWNDCAVAEGRLLRRTLPDGMVEWAPPGRWEKAYDFVGPQSDPGGAVLYLDSADEAQEDAARAASPAPFARPAKEPPAGTRATLELPRLRIAGSGLPGGAPEPGRGGAAAGMPELFPDAAWLR